MSNPNWQQLELALVDIIGSHEDYVPQVCMYMVDDDTLSKHFAYTLPKIDCLHDGHTA